MSDGWDKEPIKAMTLAEFEWNPVDAFIQHLREIDDPRVSSEPQTSDALQKGEAAHDDSFGLILSPMRETTGKHILERMRSGKVAAVNYNEYQIQGAPDDVVGDSHSVRVVEMKTTGWDDREFWKQHQLPPAAFQVRIYSWMLSKVPGVEVMNPKINVKRREGEKIVHWFTHEVEYTESKTVEQIDNTLSMLENPGELKSHRPDEGWKNDHWREFSNLGLSDAGQSTLGDYS